jgi:flagellin
MSSTINTNVASLNAQRNLSASASSLATSMQRLSSGLRVNSAKDDAAGLAIATRMDAQARGMNVAIRNANDAISLAQTGEGALGAVVNNLQRMRELAVQAANGTNGANDLKALDAEFQLLVTENDRIVANTKFNGLTILDGANSPFTFQVGPDASDTVSVAVGATTLTTKAGQDLTTNANASAALAALDVDLNAVNDIRSQWGANQGRFEQVIGNLRVAAENASASRGRIMDADYAQETANLSRAQILQQAGTAMVAQANQIPQGVLALLRQ